VRGSELNLDTYDMDLSTQDGRRLQGDRIKAAAREAGVTFEELGKRAGCSRALIYQYVSGMTLVQTDRLQQIAAVVGKPLYWFFLDAAPEPGTNPAPPPPVPQGETDGEAVSAAPATSPGPSLAAASREAVSAVARLRTLVDAYSLPPDWRRVADTCQELAVLLQRDDDLGQFSDPGPLAEVLLTQGNALIQLHEWGLAKEKLQRGDMLFRQSGQPSRALDCLQSTGHVNLMLGRVEEARDNFTEVAGGNEWRHRWQGPLSLGAVQEVVGNYAGAMECFRRAITIIEEREALGETDETRVARLYVDANWANLELDHGEFEGAAGRAGKCARTALLLGLQDQYVEALLTGAMARLHLSDLPAALALAQQALDIAQISRDQQHQSLALSCLSLCESARRDARAAITQGKEALSAALRCGVVRTEILAQRTLAEAYLLSGDVGEAGYHGTHGSAAARGSHARLPQAEFQALLAQVDLAAGRLAEAAHMAQLGLEAAQSLDAKPVQLDCRLTLARVDRARGADEDALAQAAEALSLIRAMRVPHREWRVQAVAAGASAALNREADARHMFGLALAGLDGARRQARLGDEHGPMEEPEAEALWWSWLRFVLAEEGREAARARADAAEWPPLREWLEDQLEDQLDTEDELNTDAENTKM